jgi:hypothetical protein
LRKYYYTILYLKPIQIQYQIWYRIQKIWRKIPYFKYTFSAQKEGNELNFSPWINKPVSLIISQNEPSKTTLTFNFLHQEKSFSKDKVDWDFSGYGKLWTYNLCYFDFLLQPGMNSQTGLFLLESFRLNKELLTNAFEPYPISIRGINWIKFLSQSILDHDPEYANKKPTIDSFLYSQYRLLENSPEYQLLANHLLENGFSLLYGAYYFQDEKLFRKAKTIIETELAEQILEDGAHFELSPMYHQIILDRLLDCINLLENNKRFTGEGDLLELMQEKATQMISWLRSITFANGKIPLLNDSAPDIAPTSEKLFEYAASLNLEDQPVNLKLSSSGYRKYNDVNYECIIDVGQIGPSYQPGHAHADTFNFVVNINNEAFIVDNGISTYNAGVTRLKERGTATHNTVTILDKNSSEIWSSFRVARRARVKILNEDDNTVIAHHNGYRKLGTIHQREWNFTDTKIHITDSLQGKILEGKAHFWLSPQIKPIQHDNSIVTEIATIYFENASTVNLIQTQIPNGYNRCSENYKIEVRFFKQLKTRIIEKPTNNPTNSL